MPVLFFFYLTANLGIVFVLIYLCSIHSVICRPLDHPGPDTNQRRADLVAGTLTIWPPHLLIQYHRVINYVQYYLHMVIFYKYRPRPLNVVKEIFVQIEIFTWYAHKVYALVT